MPPLEVPGPLHSSQAHYTIQDDRLLTMTFNHREMVRTQEGLALAKQRMRPTSFLSDSPSELCAARQNRAVLGASLSHCCIQNKHRFHSRISEASWRSSLKVFLKGRTRENTGFTPTLDTSHLEQPSFPKCTCHSSCSASSLLIFQFPPCLVFLPHPPPASPEGKSSSPPSSLPWLL